MSSYEPVARRDERYKAAIRNGQLEDVITLSMKFPALVRDNLLSSEALIETCMNGHLNVVQWLVENTEANINYRGYVNQISAIQEEDQPFSFTPLKAACYNGHVDIVKYIVEICHANVNLLDKGGFTPLSMACHRVQFSVAKYLINEVNDLDINFANKKKRNVALHYTIWCNKQSRTPLHEACQKRDVNKVLELVNIKGRDVNAQDNSGYTPLHTACYNGFGNIVEILMLEGADETITNDHTKTPAQVAEAKGHTEILKLLDRVSLWNEMQRKKKFKFISIGYVVVFALQLVKRKTDKKKINSVFNDTF